jgi:hypothetical protein
MAADREDRLRDALDLLRAEVAAAGGDASSLKIESGRANDPFGAKGMFYRLQGTTVDSGGWVRAGELLERITFAIAVLRLLS